MVMQTGNLGEGGIVTGSGCTWACLVLGRTKVLCPFHSDSAGMILAIGIPADKGLHSGYKPCARAEAFPL